MYELLIIVLLITTNYYHLQSLNSKAKPVRVKVKIHKHSTAYYSHLTSFFNIVLNGDIHVNPEPGSNAPKSSVCEKTVKCYQERFICDKCFSMLHMENAQIHKH